MATVTANTAFVINEYDIANTFIAVNATDTVKKLPRKLVGISSVSYITNEIDIANTFIAVNATDTVKKLPIKLAVTTALDTKQPTRFSWN